MAGGCVDNCHTHAHVLQRRVGARACMHARRMHSTHGARAMPHATQRLTSMLPPSNMLDTLMALCGAAAAAAADAVLVALRTKNAGNLVSLTLSCEA
eukprot:351689-Chlamydomonas_euryale.AAC.1